MNSKFKWLEIAQSLQSIAQAGLTYSEDKYDLERFEQIMNLSKQIVTEYSNISMEKLHKIIDMEEGYLTPKVDVRGVVVRGDKILFVKESIDQKWSLPGGWADVGYTPSEVIEKEVVEEAGIKVKAEKLLAVFDKKCHPHPPEIYYVYKMFFLCKETGGTLKSGMETTEVGFYGIDEIPEVSENRITKSQIKKIFTVIATPSETLFD